MKKAPPTPKKKRKKLGAVEGVDFNSFA